jgi:hypothetical protein
VGSLEAEKILAVLIRHSVEYLAVLPALRATLDKIRKRSGV